MAKASPHVRSFNAGELDPLLQQRTDIDRYGASLQLLSNMIATPQGPTICRSGTEFITTVRDETQYSRLVSFEFSEEQTQVLEFAQDRIRFLDEAGLQVYDPEDVEVLNAPTDVIRLRSSTLGASVGDQIVLLGFPAQYNLNGVTANVVAVSVNDYTLDISYPDLPAVDAQAAIVYHVDAVFTEAELRALRVIQSADVLYLLTGISRPRKLSRFGAYDWRLEDVVFKDGPYLDVNETGTKLTPTGTGNGVPTMTSNTTPSGVCSGGNNRPAVAGTLSAPAQLLERDVFYALDASEFYYAFDGNDDTYWASNQQQSGRIQYQAASAFVCNGYTIYPAKDNADTTYSAEDFAPTSWRFQASSDGVTWVTLDTQEDYVLYDFNKSVLFELENDTAYAYYRLLINELVRNGQLEARVRRLTLRNAGALAFNLVASSVTGINDDQGFLATDVGRLIRVQCSDLAWRACRITARNSATSVAVELEGEPLPDLSAVRRWRLGYWSDTTGWPSTGVFFDDRLWLCGSSAAPDLVAASVTGGYEVFSPTNEFGEQLDDNGMAFRLLARKLSQIRWVSADNRGLFLGTGSEEFTIRSVDDTAGLTPRTAKARPATRRGSANVEPVGVDNQTLYIQRGKRALREFAYVFEADGYKSPSMSQLANHMAQSPFEEMDYAAEPHSIVWVRRADGVIVGLTYNRDENVIGWHRHAFGDGVQCIVVSPQEDQRQDALWMIVNRSVNGANRKYVERKTAFWDFDSVVADAHYVDSALRYSGDPISVVYGLSHLEGLEVYGLADTVPFGPFTVEGGAVTLTEPASDIIIGVGYDSEAVLPSLENGAADGTAQGKTKRINSLVVSVWESYGGQIGLWNEQEGDYVLEDLEYPGDYTERDADAVMLYTGLIGPIAPTPGYEQTGVIKFRRPASSPLPFNMRAIMPQLNTQDR